jgi:hypothetical protein
MPGRDAGNTLAVPRARRSIDARYSHGAGYARDTRLQATGYWLEATGSLVERGVGRKWT